MQFRSARHTTDLQQIIDFYCGILGLKILGDFKDHDQYDGIFIGIPGKDWHLEFTVSSEKPLHKADEDDLLVFYAENKSEFESFRAKFKAKNRSEVEPKNPYWAAHGQTYMDPDGFRIVIAKRKKL